MNKFKIQITAFLFLALTVLNLNAETTKTTIKKVTTLGDLLKKAKEESRGAKAIKVEKNSVALPDAKIGFEENKAINLNEIKPPKVSDIYTYENANQAAYEKTLNLQIDELYKLTQKFKTSTNRGELWLRLAELYVEKANIVDRRKQDDFDKKLTDFQNNKTTVKPVLDMTEARDFNKKAIQLYDWFLKDFPNDSKVGQALFFLGYNNFELDNADKGTKYYEQLTSQFSNSPYAGEAHFALGENNFESEKWSEAYKEYSFLIKDSKHNLHTIALYKAAWCLYRLGKTNEGIKYMDFIIKSGRRAQQIDSGSGKKINSAKLESEATKDLVIFFSEAGDTKKAISYFKSLNTKESNSSIEKMAYYLSNKGNKEASRDVFKYLIAQDVNSKKSFEYQYQIVQNYFFSKNSPEFKSELYRWVTSYNSKSAWYQIFSSDAAFINKCNLLREQTLRNYVLQQHQTTQNSRAEFSRTSADEGYKVYFQEFSNSIQSSDMHFFYGELLYDMGRFSDAVNQYTAVVNNTPQSKYAEKSSQNILLSIEKGLPKDEELQKKVGESTQALKLDESVEKFITTSKWYLQKYPKSEKAAEIKFRAGRLYYLTNNFDPAEKEFKEIVQTYPKTKFSEYSANLLLDIYSLKKDYVGLEKMGTDLLSDENIASGKLGADIRNVMEKASFKKAQNLEVEKKYLDSAIQYQVFANQNVKSDLVGIAHFNAAINFERSGKNKEAVDNYKKVITNSNLSTQNLKPKAKRLLAKIYLDAGAFEESGLLYKELVKENPQDSLKESYIYNSALMLELTGKNQEAVSDYKNYLNIIKSTDEKASVTFKIAEIQRQQSKFVEASDFYKRYTDMPGAIADKKIESLYYSYTLDTKLGRKVEASSQEVKIKSILSSVSADKKIKAQRFLAKIKFIQSVDTFAKLKSIAIPSAQAQQKVAIDKKLEILNSLNVQLGNIVKLDSAEEIISSLSLLGEANEHMANTFKAVPVPENLNSEQKKLYISEVDKIILPFTNKSDESYKLAIERAAELQVYNEAYQFSFNKMNSKFPKLFYSGSEFIDKSKLVNWVGAK